MTSRTSAEKSEGTQDYAFVPANSVDQARLLEFAAAAWPDRTPDRVLSSWWRRAEPHCALAAIHEQTGKMAGVCGGRPSEWVIGGRPVSGVAICEWSIAPGHEGHGLGKRMAQHFAAEDNFLYTFSLSEAAVANFRRLGWVGPWQASLLALPVPRFARVAHSLFTGRTDMELRDHVATKGELPGALCIDLDRIEAKRTPLAHMRRGSTEWSWRLSICSDRTYHFCVVYRSTEPIGYVAVRRLTPGRSRILGKLSAALIIDLVAVDDDPHVLRTLARRAVAIAGGLNVAIVVSATTVAHDRNALSALGFISSRVPLFGRVMQRAAPQYMWSPNGPGAELSEGDLALSFADSDVDFNL